MSSQILSLTTTKILTTVILLPTILFQNVDARHVTKHRNLSSKHKKQKMELSVMANKFFHQHPAMQRNNQCPVCSHAELATCDWDALNASSCELPKLDLDCGCCPKCLKKEGESCGAVEDPLRPGYAGEMQSCETGLECSSYVGEGTCVVVEGFDPLMPEIDYTNDYTNDFYNYDDELLESLPLEKGCDNHATTVSTLTYFYPSALGQPLWTPECQAENPSLYKSVQCRRKENSKDHACWCVNHKSGNPTIHMDWAATDIDEKMCEDLAFEYGYGSKRKIA